MPWTTKVLLVIGDIPDCPLHHKRTFFIIIRSLLVWTDGVNFINYMIQVIMVNYN